LECGASPLRFRSKSFGPKNNFDTENNGIEGQLGHPIPTKNR
jgi:hypothetical protein